MKQEFTVENGGMRLDVYLSAVTGKTRSAIKQLCDSGAVLINGGVDKCGRIVKIGDRIELTEEEKTMAATPQDLPVTILYEDDDIAVIDKAQGMSVHPGAGNKDGTLVNALLYRLNNLSSINGTVRPGIVHRLDKDTSGVLVVAKNDAAHLSLSNQIAARKVQKLYLAILEGNLKDDEGEIVTFIGRSSRDRKKMAVLPSGKQAITHYRVLERYKQNCFVEFDIKTGRTHQIRVHAQYMGHPVVGDKTYGYAKQRFKLSGQLLHAHSIAFKHPRTGEEVRFTAPIPNEFSNVLRFLREERKED